MPQYLTSKRTSRGPTACRSTTFEANASSFPRVIALIAFAEVVIAAEIRSDAEKTRRARDSVVGLSEKRFAETLAALAPNRNFCCLWPLRDD
jgi:hypothetical protein